MVSPDAWISNVIIWTIRDSVGPWLCNHPNLTALFGLLLLLGTSIAYKVKKKGFEGEKGEPKIEKLPWRDMVPVLIGVSALYYLMLSYWDRPTAPDVAEIFVIIAVAAAGVLFFHWFLRRFYGRKKKGYGLFYSFLIWVCIRPFRLFAVALVCVLTCALAYGHWGFYDFRSGPGSACLGDLINFSTHGFYVVYRRSLYLSLVTALTLGYGDAHPCGISRVVAATESGFGFFFISMLVAVLVTKTGHPTIKKEIEERTKDIRL